jgi:NADH-ubiquinone oxidoreductase chain 5
MYLAIIILPLLGSIVAGFFGRKVGVLGAQLITCICVIVTTLLAIITFTEVGINNIPVSINVFRWFDSESLNILWNFRFDSLTVSMLIPVLIVSSLVHIYSIGYMSNDPHNQRFFSYLSLFTFMMIILVTANNFLLMFVGWEGVGICSYLLVSFWFTRIAANQSSMSAFLTNRVGDCFLTIGMFVLLWSFGNIDYSTVFSLVPFINGNIVTIIGICLLIGAMAKSSQVGLHVWLPQAMEGPTPVSALIHAATMVTAGVYLLMRASPLIEYSSTVLVLCLWLGAITTIFSSLIGLFQQDIKKVIAYSTMSQLGMMVISIALSAYNIAIFHLINHAFYKALLFLGAGAVIHAIVDNQDFRKYGGLRPFLPLTYSVMLIASLSLVAFPFMTGFYSKDLILESAYGQFYFTSTVVYFIAIIGAIFTTLYSVKVLYLTFLTNANGPLINYKNVHEGDIFMSLPLVILAIFSIFFGYISKDIFIGLGSGFFADNSIFIHPIHEILLDTEFAVPTLFKLLPLIFTISFTVIAITISEFFPTVLIRFKFNRLGYSIFSFFNQRFLIELFYNKYIIGYILKLGGQTTKILDKGSVELIGPFGLEKGLTQVSRSISSLDTGAITSYALYILIGLIFYILLLDTSISYSSMSLLILLSLFSIMNIENKTILETGDEENIDINNNLDINESNEPIQPTHKGMFSIIIITTIWILGISCQIPITIDNETLNSLLKIIDIDDLIAGPISSTGYCINGVVTAAISSAAPCIESCLESLAKNYIDFGIKYGVKFIADLSMMPGFNNDLQVYLINDVSSANSTQTLQALEASFSTHLRVWDESMDRLEETVNTARAFMAENNIRIELLRDGSGEHGVSFPGLVPDPQILEQMSVFDARYYEQETAARQALDVAWRTEQSIEQLLGEDMEEDRFDFLRRFRQRETRYNDLVLRWGAPSDP